MFWTMKLNFPHFHKFLLLKLKALYIIRKEACINTYSLGEI